MKMFSEHWYVDKRQKNGAAKDVEISVKISLFLQLTYNDI